MRIYVRRMYGGMKYERGGKDELLKGLLASSCLFEEIYGKRIYLSSVRFFYIFHLSSTFKKLGLYDFLIGNRAREISFKIVVELSF